MPSSSSRRRVDSNGQLVSWSMWPLAVRKSRIVCMGRSFVALSLLLLLWFTNPYNNPTAHPDASRFPTTHWTNYGLFSVRERRRDDGLTFYAFGQDFTCWYDRDVQDDCCLRLRNLLSHERPLIWYPRNRAYTTNRIILTVYFILGILQWCTNMNNLPMLYNNPLVSCLVSLFIPSYTSFLEAYWFLYPAWERMDRLIPWQQPNSLFRVFESDDYNFILSVTSLYVLTAVCVYAMRYYWNFQLSPQSHLTAAALGFVRGSLGSLGSERQHFARLLFLPTRWKLSPISATWTMLFLQLAASGRVGDLIPWWLANMVSAILGEYQYQNQQHVHLFDSILTGLRDSFRSLFNF